MGAKGVAVVEKVLNNSAGDALFPGCVGVVDDMYAAGALVPEFLRVEPVVAHRLPHSPVLAQLRHTVLRGTASLHSRRYPRGYGYRRSDLSVSDLLLPHGSVLPSTAPLPTPRLLGSRSPAFHRYYEAVKTPTALLPPLCSSHCDAIPWVGLAVSLPEAGQPTASGPGCC